MRSRCCCGSQVPWADGAFRGSFCSICPRNQHSCVSSPHAVPFGGEHLPQTAQSSHLGHLILALMQLSCSIWCRNSPAELVFMKGVICILCLLEFSEKMPTIREWLSIPPGSVLMDRRLLCSRTSALHHEQSLTAQARLLLLAAPGF